VANRIVEFSQNLIVVAELHNRREFTMNLDPKLKAEILAYLEFSRKTREAADEFIAALWPPSLQPPPTPAIWRRF
jgi:hypothetical protein